MLFLWLHEFKEVNVWQETCDKLTFKMKIKNYFPDIFLNEIKKMLASIIAAEIWCSTSLVKVIEALIFLAKINYYVKIKSIVVSFQLTFKYNYLSVLDVATCALYISHDLYDYFYLFNQPMYLNYAKHILIILKMLTLRYHD